MILSPDEQQNLQVIDRVLAAAEPRLAGMFGIFTRLHADDDGPPSEDLLVRWQPSAAGQGSKTRTRRRSRPRGNRQRGSWPSRTMERQTMQRQLRRGGTERGGTEPGRAEPGGAPRSGIRRVLGALAIFAVPALLVTTLVLVVVFGLTSSIRCRTVPAAAASRTVSVAVPAGSGFAACPAPAKTSVAKTSVAKGGAARR